MEKIVSLKELELIAAEFMKTLRMGDVVFMEGNLGSGKTTFVRAAIQSVLGFNEVIPSPTFTLVQTYDADPPIWHYDLYRLVDPEEVFELGMEEAFSQGITFVEWPQRMGEVYKGKYYTVLLNTGNSINTRVLKIIAPL